MSGVPQQPDENDASYRLDRWAGLTIVGSIVLSLLLLFIGEPLFWVPFAAGIGIGVPTLAILADRERDRAASEEQAASEKRERNAGGEESE
jgi:hypothetical protein